MKIMIRTWKITKTSIEEIQFMDISSLDAITRQLPEGYYSTFRTYDRCTRVLGLSSHLRRFYEPVSTAEVNASSLRRELITLLVPYRPEEARVRVIMTKQGQVYVSMEELRPLPLEVYEQGVRVETTELQRYNPRLKSTAFIDASHDERKHIAQAGIFEALLVRNGRILEGMTSNIFYVKDGILHTAQRDILLGVTRKTVLQLARSRGLEVKYQPLKQDQISAASEAFMTSSSRGIVPIIQIDEVRIGQGGPGPITKQLSEAYEAYVIAKAEKI